MNLFLHPFDKFEKIVVMVRVSSVAERFWFDITVHCDINHDAEVLHGRDHIPEKQANGTFFAKYTRGLSGNILNNLRS